MSDNIIKLILNKLDRIEEKQDKQAEQTSKILERLAKIEEKQRQQDKINEKVNALETIKDKGAGIKIILAWLISIALSVLAFLKPHF